MLGPPASGKTSIRYCFFKGAKPEDVLKNPPEPTIKEEERFDHFDFFLRIVDLGGQESFIDTWSGDKEEELFTATDAVLYVVDAADRDHRNMLKAIRILERVALSISKYCPRTRVHIFLHKMDIVRTRESVTYFREELMKVVSSGMKEIPVAFHETSIVDGTSNNALRTVLNEVMPSYEKYREAFRKVVSENRDVDIIQLLAPRKSDLEEGREALIVAEAISPARKVGGNGVKVDFSPFIRSLDDAMNFLDESGVEYNLMRMRSGRIVILKDLSQYYAIIESRKQPNENLFLRSVDHILTVVRDVEKLMK
jgi:GTPase SAR1 family protein